MGLKDTLDGDVRQIVQQPWDIRDGRVVPESTDLALAGGAVRMTATILYADLADSTGLAMKHDRRVAAKVGKAFLATCSKIIRAHSGEIRSFDGDRVMAAFVGDGKETAAAKCALKINYTFLKILRPRFENAFASLKEFRMAHCTGIDTSEVMIVRGGIRSNNDLVWIGQAPNVAAKLSNLRESPYHSWITKAVFDALGPEALLGSQGEPLWEERKWTTGPVARVFGSKGWWEP